MYWVVEELQVPWPVSSSWQPLRYIDESCHFVEEDTEVTGLLSYAPGHTQVANSGPGSGAQSLKHQELHVLGSCAHMEVYVHAWVYACLSVCT
jgi:hypothetical protein